jgi:hypothetical protein
MNHREKPKSWWKPRSRSRLSLLDNNLIQFLIGLFLIALVTQAVNSLEDLYLKLVLSTIGYGIFFYLSTPFTIYWLAYISSVRLTQVKLGITVLLVGIYSYLLWDCYFFYRDILGELFFSFSPI